MTGRKPLIETLNTAESQMILKVEWLGQIRGSVQNHVEKYVNLYLFLVCVVPFMVWSGQVFWLISTPFGGVFHVDLPSVQTASVLSTLLLVPMIAGAYGMRRKHMETAKKTRLMLDSKVSTRDASGLSLLVNMTLAGGSFLYVSVGLLGGVLQTLGVLLSLATTLFVWFMFNFASLKRAVDLQLYIFIQGVGFVLTCGVLFFIIGTYQIIASLAWDRLFIAYSVMLLLVLLIVVFYWGYKSSKCYLLKRRKEYIGSVWCEPRKRLAQWLWKRLTHISSVGPSSAKSDAEKRLDYETQWMATYLADEGLGLYTYALSFLALLGLSAYFSTLELQYLTLFLWVAPLYAPYLLYLSWRFMDVQHLVRGGLLRELVSSVTYEELEMKLTSQSSFRYLLDSVARNRQTPYESLGVKESKGGKTLSSIVVLSVITGGIIYGLLSAIS